MNDADRSTRDRLIAHARRLFAIHGFRGASVREITTAARANLGAITYHFGSKRALYDATLDATFAELVGRVEATAQAPGSAGDRVRGVVQTLFAFFRERPEAPRLVLHELVSGARLPAQLAPYAQRNLGAIRRVVGDGVASGEFRATADPLLVTFSLMSQVIWFAIAGREIAGILGQTDDPASFAERVSHHVADALVSSLTPEGRPA
jgi:AcrR family transcriptional regulator